MYSISEHKQRNTSSEYTYKVHDALTIYSVNNGMYKGGLLLLCRKFCGGNLKSKLIVDIKGSLPIMIIHITFLVNGPDKNKTKIK